MGPKVFKIGPYGAIQVQTGSNSYKLIKIGPNRLKKIKYDMIWSNMVKNWANNYLKKKNIEMGPA